MDITITIQ